MRRVALLVSILAAAIGAFMLYSYMERFESVASGGDQVTILIATEDIALGNRIREDALARRSLPAKFVEERHVRAADLQRIVGIPLASSVKSNEALLWTDLASSAVGSRRVEQFLQEGMRALTVNGDPTSAMLLAPGNRVDIFLTTAGVSSDGGRQTNLLLQNVIVIAVGHHVGNQGIAGGMQAGYGGTGVTLSVLPRQASFLTLAQQTGTLTFTIRSSGETNIVRNPPPTVPTDLIDEEQIVQVRLPEPPAAAAPPPRRSGPVRF